MRNSAICWRGIPYSEHFNMNRQEAIEKYGEADERGHVTRFSDSSFYDEVCVLCGATDRPGGNYIYGNNCGVDPIEYESDADKIKRLGKELAAAGRNIVELQQWTKKEVNRIFRKGYESACDDAADIARRSKPLVVVNDEVPVVANACENIALDILDLKEIEDIRLV